MIKSDLIDDGAEYDRIIAGTSATYVIAEDGQIVRRDAPPRPKHGPGHLNGERAATHSDERIR